MTIYINGTTGISGVDGSAGTPAVQGTDTNTGIYYSAADTVDVATGGVQRGQFDSSGNFKFNSGYGSVATAYGCRAWVNFNGTGTVAIRASGNVSSITDNGTGDYSVNFTTAMPDANYAAMGNCDTNAAFSVQFVCMFNNPTGNTDSAPTTSSFRFGTREAAGSGRDEDYVLISVFR